MLEPVHDARFFDAPRPYLVFAELPTGRRQLCGLTPRPGPVRIPEHLTWWVRPILPTDERGLMCAAEHVHDIVADLQDHDIPGLDLEHSDVDGRALVDLDGRAQLRWLSLSRCPDISDASLACLADFKWLRQLALSGCPRVTDAGMRYVGRLTELRYLDLDGCQSIGAPGLARLSGLAKLGVLSMRGCTRVNDEALDEIARLAALEWLDLSECGPISNDGLARLRSLERLCTLRLAG
jgi:hypothetical protein